ncbi:MAG TPA: hypothetical protein VKW76_10815 [Candidatus Binatia bacterium]|nr:hypothetical protein [Candidatus Binatia bacterium]
MTAADDGAVAPRVSFVVGSRNDDHGGNPRRRTELFLHALAALARRAGLAAELIVVEWNPPPDRPPLREALTWPTEPGPLVIRVITVPAAVHARVGNAERIPFFQMIAKNVGIRRAQGAFVVATNIDLLFSEALIWFLARGPLDPACAYRVERLDLALRDLPDGLDVEEQLAVCSMNVARVCTARGSVERDRRRLRARYGHGAEPFRGFPSGTLASHVGRAARGDRPHFEACGDFTMLARSAWERLRGYPELPLHSMHQDSILLKMALVSGLRQVVLPDPMRAYHVEHGMGWGAVEDRADILRLPQLGDGDVARWLARLDEAGAPLTPNGPDWGFAGEPFPEWRAGPAPAEEARAC